MKTIYFNNYRNDVRKFIEADSKVDGTKLQQLAHYVDFFNQKTNKRIFLNNKQVADFRKNNKNMSFFVEISNGSTPVRTIELPIVGNAEHFPRTQNFLYDDGIIINWGDNTTTHVHRTSGANATHTYKAGEYNITITGKLYKFGRVWQSQQQDDLFWDFSSVDEESQYFPRYNFYQTLTGFYNFGPRLQLRSLQGAFCLPDQYSYLTEPNQLYFDVDVHVAYIPSTVTNMSHMFKNCYYDFDNRGLQYWDVSNVTDMSSMFFYCFYEDFNPPVGNWDVGNVTTMQSMFYYCHGDDFNPDISNWDVSNVEDMTSLFSYCGASFEPCIDYWDVGKVESMAHMFNNFSTQGYNPNFSNWNTINVKNMSYMFANASGDVFNPNITDWNVSNVTNMSSMFRGCNGVDFNPELTNWNVSNVTNMSSMFRSCNGKNFNGGMGDANNMNQGLTSWILKSGNNSVDMSNFLTGANTLDTIYVSNLLETWASNFGTWLPSQITIHFPENQRYDAEFAGRFYEILIHQARWTIHNLNPI